MIQLLYVFFGGGLGSMARFGISKWISQTEIGFPWATFVANLVSCIILGFLIGYQVKNGLNNNGKLLLMTGFCGGFSTFSTFSAETFGLLQSQNINIAFIYIAASVLCCLVCIYVGIKLMLWS